MEGSLGLRVILFVVASAGCGNVSHDVGNTSMAGGAGTGGEPNRGGAGTGGEPNRGGAGTGGEPDRGGAGTGGEPNGLSLCAHELTFGAPSPAMGFEGTLDGEPLALEAWIPDDSEQPVNTAHVWLFRPSSQRLEAVGFALRSDRGYRVDADFWVGTESCLYDGSWAEEDALYSGRVVGQFESSVVVERGASIGTASGQVRLSFTTPDGTLVHELDGRFTLPARVGAPMEP